MPQAKARTLPKAMYIAGIPNGNGVRHTPPIGVRFARKLPKNKRGEIQKKRIKMAIFHLELRQIKRQTAKGKIKKVAAIVAYRERIKIDKFNYSNRNDFVESFCLFPPDFENYEYAKKLKNPDFFANEIEKIEKRKDSQLFDEIILALPHELNIQQNKEIITKLITDHYILPNSQMARICIHRTNNNMHCHILIPQRPLESSENGVKFGKKIRQEFSKMGPKSADKLIKIREDWAKIVNSKLSEIGSAAKISNLSIKNRHTEALAIGDFELASRLNRPTFYLPVAAYSPKFKLITLQNDRFAPDLEKMEQAKKHYAKRHNLNTYKWDDLLEEREFWNELENQGRLKIGVGMTAIRLMIKRLIKIITTKNFTDLHQNDSKRNERMDRGSKNPAPIFKLDQPNSYASSITLFRDTRPINHYINSRSEHGRADDQATIQESNELDQQIRRNEQINKKFTTIDQLAFNKPTNGINILRSNRHGQNWGFVSNEPAKNPKRKPRR